MLVHVMADASWDADRFGGYGLAIKSGRGSRDVSSPFRVRWLDHHLAEYASAVMGIWFSVEYGIAYCGDTVLVHNDSKWAVNALRGKIEAKPSKEAQYWQIANLQRELTDTYQLTVKPKHVRGHVGQTKAEQINEFCDQLARDGRLEARKML